MPNHDQPSNPGTSALDALVVGAGFAGLYQLYRLREMGMRAKLLEAGDSVGGTWYWNRYPGARCDIPSIDYSYSFSVELQQEWEWSEKYATQPEILRYLEFVATKFDLRRDIQFGQRVVSAAYDEGSASWTVRTEAGLRLTTQFLIMATGNLTAARIPDIPGVDDFGGVLVHTAEWPRDGVDVAGKRVGVVGTGSSGVQVIPVLAEHAAHVTVFQRTPGFLLPAHNRPLTDAERRRAKEVAPQRHDLARRSSFGADIPNPIHRALEVDPAERQATFEKHWNDGAVMPLLLSYRDLMTNREANATAAEFLRGKINELVHDPQTAKALTPTGFPFGSKRTCVGTNYPQVFNEEHVQLVDLREEPIDAISAGGVRTSRAEYPLDILVFATGFDAMTGALTRIDIRGRSGLKLTDTWSDGPKNYLGLAVHGFPNMFMITGPGSPSVLSNLVIAIEQHVEWVTDCLSYLRDQALATIEADAAAEAEWVDQINTVAAATLYPEGNSWYVGANIPGKPRGFTAYTRGLSAYSRICDEIVADGYRGFLLGARESYKTEAHADAGPIPKTPAS